MSNTQVTGIISDTHMPDRWAALPDRVFHIFAEVDLIIHAGDVGELWVLDQLSQSAPVVAVHGNDETAEAEAALPYLQTLSIAGHRIVVTHAHYPDRAEEIASRTNPWQPKFDRRATFAKAHGASICIFGHTHIPMVQQHQGIYLYNSGAIASGNPWTRQTIQTVALLTLTPNTEPEIEHIDLATGEQHTPFFDTAGFMETATHYNQVIFQDHFMPHREFIWHELRPIDLEAVHASLLSICHEVWAGKRDIVTTEALVDRFLALNNKQVTAKLAEHSYFSQYL